MSENNFKTIKQGAEAKLIITQYLGKPTIIKERFQKKYRHTDLDASITRERMKNEARSILRCKTADINTPTLYLVDFERGRIYMEYFQHNITVKEFIINIVSKLDQRGGGDDSTLNTFARIIGETVRKLHDSQIIHGDLTTSNMLLVQKKVRKGEICDDSKWLDISNINVVIIDFGLSYIDTRAEDKGVDLYVLERALISTHSDYPELFNVIMEGYKAYKRTDIKEILSKFEEVRARGRKRTMIG